MDSDIQEELTNRMKTPIYNQNLRTNAKKGTTSDINRGI